MRRKAVVALAGMLVSVVGSVTPAAAALSGFGEMVVDAAHDHVFVSSGPSGSSITVFDLSGKVVETITGEPGASAMVLDGSKLYVLLTSTGAVHVVDTATLARTDTYPVPLANSETDMVMAGGKLWFGTGGCGQWDGKLTSLDPATGAVQSFDGPTNSAFLCTNVAAAPDDPGTLIAYDAGLSPPTLYKYDVSSGAALAGQSRLASSGGPNDVAFSPDGSTIFLAAGSPYEIQAFSAADFSKTGSYPTGPYPSAVAVSPDGGSVGAGVKAAYDSDVFVFPRTGGAPELELDFGEGAGSVLPGGLAFAPDGSRVFAVVGDAGSSPVFRVVGTDMAPTTLSLSVSDDEVPYKGSVTVAADLGGRGSLEGQRVSIYKTPYGGTKKLVKTAAVDSKGVVRATVELTSKTTFVAEYSGSADLAASKSKSSTVRVGSVVSSSIHGFYGAEGKYKLFHYGDQPVQRGKVTPNHAGGSLLFTLQIFEDGKWRTIDSASVSMDEDSSGNVVVIGGGSPHDYRSRAVFAGDADHLGAKSRWTYFRFRA